jgi:endoplasmic reticulum resident protein 44
MGSAAYPAVCLLVFFSLLGGGDSGAVQLDASNIDAILEHNEFVFINFYADWCRFSNMLAPIWDEGADKIAAELPGKKVVMGRVDCDKETSLGSRFHITKYPTIKFVQNGVLAKKEYRGQRSADSFLDFVKEHVQDPVTEFTDLSQLKTLDEKKRHLIGYFSSPEGQDYESFKKSSLTLKEDCQFHAGFGSQFDRMRPPGQNIVAFRPSKARDSESDQTFTGSLADFETFNAWAVEKCSPLVREITFENAEELTEEGLPFLILFHAPEDTQSIKEYTELVTKELVSEKTSVNFLTADGVKFAHPLHHLGKSKEDLPLIAIDSFRHMYLFSKYEDMKIPGKVKTFLQGLYSGKLHREFHYGPDQEEEKKEVEDKSEDKKEEEKPEEKPSEEGTDDAKHIPRTDDEEPEKSSKKPVKSTDPPESQFVHLGPSKNRYTILRDEF